MDRQTDSKIIIVTRKTRLENLIVQYNTFEQAKFVIDHSDGDFDYYVNEDKIYKSVVNKAVNILEGLGRVHNLDREYISNYIFGKNDIVVVIGQDGLVANTLKYLNGQSLIGINPDPNMYDGVLLPFNINDLNKVVLDLLQGSRKNKEITLAKAELNDGQSILAVNDLFIGQRTHVSARYILKEGDKQERQSSSGIIVSTGLGKTGWFKSIIKGAAMISKNNLLSNNFEKFTWNSDFLYYTVREPYESTSTQANMVFGKIDKENSFTIKSLMPENGVIFSDGIESDYISFNSGSEVKVDIAENKGLIVV